MKHLLFLLLLAAVTGCAAVREFSKSTIHYKSIKVMPVKDILEPVLLFDRCDNNFFYPRKFKKFYPDITKPNFFLYKLEDENLNGDNKKTLEFEILGELEFILDGFGRSSMGIKNKEYFTKENIERLYSKIRSVGGDALVISLFHKPLFATASLEGYIIAFK